MRNTEALIRKGYKQPKPVRKKFFKPVSEDATIYARAFMCEFIFKHSQSSPADSILYIDFKGQRELYVMYQKEVRGRRSLKFHYFCKVWNKVLCAGVTDPETGVSYEVQIRKSKAKGFKKCDRCQYLKMRISGATTKCKKVALERKLSAHISSITADREALARIQRLCITRENHLGFFLDAADSAKFAIPTTKSTAKMMSKLWTIKQKLTCVQMFDAAKTLYMYRTLPTVPTGGNLTATILTDVINKQDMSKVTDVWINVDGAGDNICYTVYYYLAHILLSAREKGWPLRRIHLLRAKVGHTHNDLDATFAKLSKFIYGKHSRGDSRKNILSFSSFKRMCQHVYGDRLTAFVDIQRNYDFDEFVSTYRPGKADNHIKKQFAVDFEVRSVEGKSRVFIRSKSRMSDKEAWHPWTQMYPSLLTLRRHQPHSPSTIPPTAPNNVWEDFLPRVCPTLRRFYNGSMKHGITIPEDDSDEMLHFFAGELPDGEPPAWITWGTVVHDHSDSELASDNSDSDNDEDNGDDYVPFLHQPLNPGGRKCRCGSQTHMTTNSHACPLNPRYLHPIPDDDNTEDGSSPDHDNNEQDSSPDHDNNEQDSSPNRDNNEQDSSPNRDNSDRANSDRANSDNDSDDPDTPPAKRSRSDTTIPPFRRPRLRSYKKGDIVVVNYNGTWWKATIMYKHRGKYCVKYHDTEGNVEKQVSDERIRPF